MRIVKNPEFLKLPEGTIFAYFKLCVFSGLYRKLRTLTGIDGENVDFFYQDLIHCLDVNDSGEFVDILHKSAETGESFNISPTDISRDGLFDKEAMYAVYEPEDIRKIATLLTEGNFLKSVITEAFKAGYNFSNFMDESFHVDTKKEAELMNFEISKLIEKYVK